MEDKLKEELWTGIWTKAQTGLRIGRGRALRDGLFN